MFHPKLIEEKIQKAFAEGKFENLKGTGEKIDLTAYFNTPSEYRVGYTLLKSNKFVPEEVELLKEISGLKEKMENAGEDVSAKEKMQKELREKQLSLSVLLERNKRKRF